MVVLSACYVYVVKQTFFAGETTDNKLLYMLFMVIVLVCYVYIVEQIFFALETTDDRVLYILVFIYYTHYTAIVNFKRIFISFLYLGMVFCLCLFIFLCLGNYNFDMAVCLGMFLYGPHVWVCLCSFDE